jgi:PLP dependent protein
VISLAANLLSIRSRIDAACARAGRDPSEVTLIGVTKKHPAETISAAFEAGIVDVGENYVQELVEKHGAVNAAVRWHFIGHLQRNKVRQIAGFVHIIHGVDSERLAIEIGRQAILSGRTIPILLQVNTSGEPSKFGVAPSDAVTLARALASVEGIELVGMMTLAAFLDDPELTRPMFRLLRTLRDDARSATGLPLPHLSMGMTADFEVAIEEGATFVRIGTALFGERQ